MKTSARKDGLNTGTDRLVVRTLGYDRSNLGSNPGLDRISFCTVDKKPPPFPTENLEEALIAKNSENK